MGLCLSSKSNENKSYRFSVNENDNVWEFLHSQLVEKRELLSDNGRSKAPALCNYMILFRNKNRVIKCYISSRKKYRTTDALDWHLSLTGLPANAKIYISDEHLAMLYSDKQPATDISV